MFFVCLCVCTGAYSTFILLCSDGFHQHGHRGCRASDVRGACVNHSCAALCTKHHLHPHWNARWIKQAQCLLFYLSMGTCMDMHTHMHTHIYQQTCLSYEMQISPFHGYFPFARLSGVHIVKVSSVVIWVCATKDQFSTWRVFWIPESNQYINHQIHF